jgi:hypothetical protein
MMRWLLLGVVAAVLFPSSAQAHQKSISYSKWTLVDGGAVAELKVRWLELTSLPAARDAPGAAFDSKWVIPYLQEHLVLWSEADVCQPEPASAIRLPAEPGWLRIEWRVRCRTLPTSIRSDLFASLTNHVHLATLSGPISIDVVLSPAAPSATLDFAIEERGRHGIASYLRLGIEHILSGWDHLAFLILLIVMARRLRDVAVLVTGFTVGHSTTLAAAALGVVVPHPRAVEATIAASILIVALENAGMQQVRGGWALILGAIGLFAASAALGSLPAFWGLALFTACYFGLLRLLPGAGRLRWAIACLFGLVHGLGFSGVLLEQELPRGQLVQALLGFNLGVELGQLAVVALIWPVLGWLRRQELGARVVDVTSIAGAAIGTFALLVRAFG